MPRSPTSSQPKRAAPATPQRVVRWLRSVLAGIGRLFTPGARGVYPPHRDSLIVLGVALPHNTDIDDLARRLWWRGLGVVERERHVIVGADITAAVQKRRVRQARQFVIKQLRNAGVRGVVKRWEHPSLGVKGQASRVRNPRSANSKQTKHGEPKTKNRKSNSKSNT
jgi:hypothetical protein